MKMMREHFQEKYKKIGKGRSMISLFEDAREGELRLADEATNSNTSLRI